MFLLLLLTTAQPDPAAPVPLIVSPAAAPVPALKYELLPKRNETRPGNAAVGYYQAALLRPAWPKDPAKAKKQTEQDDAFRNVPIEELSARELTEYLKPYQTIFRVIDHAATYDRCEWQRDNQLSGEGLHTLLPDIQQHRELTQILTLRTRLAAVENKFDDAVQSLRTGLQQSKHLGEGPSYIHLLVGLAMANNHLKRMEDVIQRPGSPNLYWALTALPRPLIDHRPAADGEDAFLESLIPGLKAIERGPVTADQATQAIETLFESIKDANDSAVGRTLRSKIGIVGYAALYHAEAKKELLAHGRTAAELDAMPPTQVVLLRSLGQYRELRDEHKKLFFLPYPDAVKSLAVSRERTKALREGADPLAALFSLTVPTAEKLFEAQSRTERRLALLRAVEAVRLHAAGHGGTPPTSLTGIAAVSVPDDPNTGKPFDYAADGKTVRITAPPPAGKAPSISNSMGYILTLRK